MSHGDEIVLAEEDVRLAELQMTGRRNQVRRSQHHEHGVLVEFELRPLMRVVGVLDREVVQTELLLHGAQDVLLRLVESEPDELIRFLECAANLPDANVGHAHAAAVGGAVDHRGRSRARGFGRQRLEHVGHVLQLTPVGRVLFDGPAGEPGLQGKTRPT